MHPITHAKTTKLVVHALGGTTKKRLLPYPKASLNLNPNVVLIHSPKSNPNANPNPNFNFSPGKMGLGKTGLKEMGGHLHFAWY